MRRWISAAIVSVSATFALAGPVAVDPDLPDYQPVAGVSGDIKSVGSDTMVNLMTHWAEVFGRHYPAVRVQVEGKGSSTAPPALLEGQSQFGPMSRAMEPSEIDAFRAKFGFEPTELRVGIDCIAVFVHKDCPLDEITIDQLTEAFTVAGSDMTWGDLGVTDAAWKDKPLSLYGRNSASGTYKFFKKVGCNNNDFKPTVKEAPGSAGVINAVASDRFAIGYSGVGYATPDVKALRVAFDDASDAVAPDADGANSGEYPIARFLYLYLVKESGVPLDTLRAEFIKMIYSREGQESLIKDGSFPVSADIARAELAKVDIASDF